MRLAEYESLICACGGGEFAVLTRLKLQPGGGTITIPGGYWCVKCQSIVEPQMLRQILERKRAVEEVKRLQATLEPIPPTPAAAEMADLIKQKVI